MLQIWAILTCLIILACRIKYSWHRICAVYKPLQRTSDCHFLKVYSHLSVNKSVPCCFQVLQSWIICDCSRSYQSYSSTLIWYLHLECLLIWVFIYCLYVSIVTWSLKKIGLDYFCVFIRGSLDFHKSNFFVSVSMLLLLILARCHVLFDPDTPTPCLSPSCLHVSGFLPPSSTLLTIQWATWCCEEEEEAVLWW